MQYKAHYCIGIENPALVIWLMSGMLVFDLDIVAIDAPERSYSAAPFVENGEAGADRVR